ncbi:30S ribosomal protein S6 [Mechercharimyces sp. CAU 1602]|uniref:30S ribosomal protein S6 n=1 Tax=Mechercharimyces sp. CAU 1602 TaxID=2973933 RepID=UPI00216281C0|nr:30S ribosomal protein S6 [Mechercharimyces sp. CAU 1602]MCS1352674.1 30S ribosomal protein S6 [Mechercharimyces sp. CAU 1602]
MKKYEMMYIVRPDVDEETLKATREAVETTISKNGGENVASKDFGKRRFAYEIEDAREGFYTVTTFDAKNETLNELDRIMKLNDRVLRKMVISLDDK